MKNYLRSKRVMPFISAFFLAIAVIPGNVGWATPTAFAAESEIEQAKGSGMGIADKEKAKHEDMPKDKEHDGMHGMMMGHDMKGWWIVIGVVMVIMMGAHVVVLF